MGEFIVEYPDDLIAEGYVEACINVHERIVRCNDCKWYVGVHENFYYCELFQETIQGGTEMHKPKPDGFCSWGERREDA